MLFPACGPATLIQTQFSFGKRHQNSAYDSPRGSRIPVPHMGLFGVRHLDSDLVLISSTSVPPPKSISHRTFKKRQFTFTSQTKLRHFRDFCLPLTVLQIWAVFIWSFIITNMPIDGMFSRKRMSLLCYAGQEVDLGAISLGLWTRFFPYIQNFSMAFPTEYISVIHFHSWECSLCSFSLLNVNWSIGDFTSNI